MVLVIVYSRRLILVRILLGSGDVMSEKHTFKLPLKIGTSMLFIIDDENHWVAECESAEKAQSLVDAANMFPEAVELLRKWSNIYMDMDGGITIHNAPVTDTDSFLTRIKEAQDA